MILTIMKFLSSLAYYVGTVPLATKEIFCYKPNRPLEAALVAAVGHL